MITLTLDVNTWALQILCMENEDITQNPVFYILFSKSN